MSAPGVTPAAPSRPGRSDRPRAVVLHVLEAVATGSERHLVDLVRHIDQFQHIVAIPSQHHGLSTAAAAERLERAGAQIQRVEMGRSRAIHAHLLALMALRRAIRLVEPDIIHGHSSIGGALARLASWGSAIPTVYTPHAFSRSRWAIPMERLLSRRADRLIAVSDSEREFAENHRLASGGRIVVIPNGIDPDPPPPLSEPLRGRLGLGPDVPLVGSVGRLAWQKAPEIFVAACARVHQSLPEAHFVLVASGPMQQQLEQAVRDSGIASRFHLIPHLADAAAAIAEFDVFVLASRFEGGPYTLLEAMRAGTAVIVTDVAGNRDVVHDGVNGLIVPIDEPRLLADGIRGLLQDPKLRLRLVGFARQAVRTYSVQEMAAATARLYADLLG